MRYVSKIFIIGIAILGILPGQTKAQLDIYGSLESDAYVFVEDSARMAKEITNLRLKFASSAGQVGFYGSTDLYHTPGETTLDLWEGYVDLYGSFYDLRIGKQIVTWGTGDNINPTDNLNPWDLGRKTPFSEPAEKKLPVNMVNAKFYLGSFTTLNAIWILDYHPFRLPDTSVWNMSRSLPQPTVPPGITVTGVGSPVDAGEPANTLENSEYALKFASTFAGVDYSASYFHGWENFPTLHPEMQVDSVNAQGQKFATVTPVQRYHSIDVVGGDFATSVYGIGVRGEAGYFMTEDMDEEDPYIADPYWFYVFGLDYTFHNGLYVNTQYSEGVYRKFGIQADQGDDRMVNLGFTYDVNDYNSLEIGSMYLIEDENYILQPKYIRTIGNAVDLTLGAYIIDGNSAEHFGAFRSNDQVYAELKYSF